MDTINLTHVPLTEVQPGSLLLIGATDGDPEQYFAIAVDGATGAQSATRWVSFRADRGALRAVRTELSPTQKPERLVLNLGQHFALEPNLYEQVRTDVRDLSALKPGDLLAHGVRQLLVVAAAADKRPQVIDLVSGEVNELSVVSVAVITHWNIYVRSAEGQRLCLVDTKSHKQATAH
jgi:hypothetical protein